MELLKAEKAILKIYVDAIGGLGITDVQTAIYNGGKGDILTLSEVKTIINGLYQKGLVEEADRVAFGSGILDREATYSVSFAGKCALRYGVTIDRLALKTLGQLVALAGKPITVKSFASAYFAEHGKLPASVPAEFAKLENAGFGVVKGDSVTLTTLGKNVRTMLAEAQK